MDIPRISKPVSNNAGLGQEALIAELDWFTTIAVPVGPFTNYGDDSIIAGDHVFVATKGFRQIYISNRSSELTADYLGDQDTRSVMPKLNAFMPGINPVTTTFFAENKRYIVLIPDIDCGTTRYVQVGTKCRGAEIPASSVKMKGGKAESNDPRGHEFEINGFAPRMYFYDGAVTLYP
jgi:hypothetical protein